MKFFAMVLLAAAAVAEPEADPQILLNNGLIAGSPLAYSSGIVGAPLATAPLVTATSTGLAGYAIGALNTPVVTSAAVASPLVSRIWKREAEAEADPALLLNGGLIAGSPLAYSSGIIGAPLAARTILPATTVVNTPTTIKESQVSAGGVESSILTPTISQSVVSSPVVASAPIVSSPLVSALGARIWKREAESEPEADPALLLNNGLIAGSPLAYSSGLIGAPLATRTILPAAAPIATRTILPAAAPIATAPLVTKTILPAATTTTVVGSPLISTLGARIWKREAEAEPEADPAILLNNGLIAGSPLAYNSGIVGAPLVTRTVIPAATPASTLLTGNAVIAPRTLIAGSPLITGSPLLW